VAGVFESLQRILSPKLERIETVVENLRRDFERSNENIRILAAEYNALRERVSGLEAKYEAAAEVVYLKVMEKIRSERDDPRQQPLLDD
jgi:predicted nuclease with TOPRIM domain